MASSPAAPTDGGAGELTLDVQLPTVASGGRLAVTAAAGASLMDAVAAVVGRVVAQVFVCARQRERER